MTRRSMTKRRLSWIVMAVVLSGSLFVAATGDRSPQTESERIDAVSSDVRCPTCRGQSVRESNAPAAQAIRGEIARRIRSGESDEEIRSYLVSRYGEKILLNPPDSGLASLVWVLPVAGVVIASASVAAALWRWKKAAVPTPSSAPSTPSKLKRSRLRIATTVVVVALLAGGAGIAAAISSGTRRPGDVITGVSIDKQAERMAKAVELTAAGKQLEALKLYDAILADEPDNVDALTERGLLLGLLGRASERTSLIERGITSLDEALALKPNEPRILFYKGLVFRFLGNDAGALESFRAALMANPAPSLRSEIEGFLSTAGIGDAPVPAPTSSP